MDRISCLVIVDPSREAAEHVARQCHRLAENRVVVTSGEEAMTAVVQHKPEMVLLSLEINHPDATVVTKKLLKQRPDLFITATFRELAVPTMEKLGKLGVEDFIPQPIELTPLFRAASERFNKRIRQHDRFPVKLDVNRADDVQIGTTIDISEGGMQMLALHPIARDESVLVNLVFPGQEDHPLKVRCDVLDVSGEPPQNVVARLMFKNLRGEEHRRLTDFLGSLDSE